MIRFAAIKNGFSVHFWARDWEHAESIAKFQGYKQLGKLIKLL